jgi:hypothetical protein
MTTGDPQPPPSRSIRQTVGLALMLAGLALMAVGSSKLAVAGGLLVLGGGIVQPWPSKKDGGGQDPAS